MINVHHLTIYREIARNSINGTYNPDDANSKSMARRIHARKNKKISQETWYIAEQIIRLDFRPEQISGLLERSGVKIISHETIYQHILADKSTGGTLWKHLRWSNKKRRKRYGKQHRRGMIPDRVSIDQRPAIVNEKCRIGDWEIDTAIGKKHQGALIVAVERKSKFALISWSRY